MNVTDAWQKITNGPVTVGRIGAIPVYDGKDWHIFRNSATIWAGLENAADPVKVEKLRRSTVLLLERFPATVPQLEKLGIRVKTLLNKPIRTTAEVTQWAESLFNTGPTANSMVHIEDAMNLAWDDLTIQVRTGRSPQYVIPAAPKGSDIMATLEYSVPGSKLRYGPRHEFSRTAFLGQFPGQQTSIVRPRGRPRKDGLMPGSPEAKAADQKRQEAVEQERAKRLQERAKRLQEKAAKPKRTRARTTTPRTSDEQLATVTELPVKRRFVRIGKSKSALST